MSCILLIRYDYPFANYFSRICLMTLTGFPAAMLSAATSFVTTLPAPMMQRAPFVTPLSIITPAPIKQSSPIVTEAYLRSVISSFRLRCFRKSQYPSVYLTYTLHYVVFDKSSALFKHYQREASAMITHTHSSERM